jgi:enoyl-CoA hydratase
LFFVKVRDLIALIESDGWSQVRMKGSHRQFRHPRKPGAVTIAGKAGSRKPVLAAIQGYCLGGAIDLVAACDMRYATVDAQFSIKEIDIGMAADVGTLQRLPRIIGDGMMRELAFTGRTIDGEEARSIGLVNRTFADTDALLDGVMAIAREIASKSPVAVRGTKEMIRYMHDHRVDDGLEYIATWNAAMLQSVDLRVAMAAHMSKQKPEFAD